MGRALRTGNGATTAARKAAVIAWALAVAVVLLVHGAGPHAARSGGLLLSAGSALPSPDPCHHAAPGHGARSDPGDGGRPAPWHHCDAVLHRTASVPSGNGGHACRACAAAGLAAPAAARPARVRRSGRAARHDVRPIRERLQVFRC